MGSDDEDEECKPCGTTGDDNMDAEEEGTKHKLVRAPGEPSKTEREHHEVDHIPFRSWCKHCIRGRGKSMPHFKKTSTIDKDDKIPKSKSIIASRRKMKKRMAASWA